MTKKEVKKKKKKVKKKESDVKPACKNFNAMKKIDAIFTSKSTYKKVKCPYCDEIHIDKLPKEAIKNEEPEM